MEQVRDAATFRVMLILPHVDEALPIFHQTITLLLTGIRAPVNRQNVEGMPDLAEPFADEAKYFVELKLLQREVKVVLEGVSNQNFVGSIQHPAGNIAEVLCANGYARLVDWSLTLLSDSTIAPKLRAAEKYPHICFNHCVLERPRTPSYEFGKSLLPKHFLTALSRILKQKYCLILLI